MTLDLSSIPFARGIHPAASYLFEFIQRWAIWIGIVSAAVLIISATVSIMLILSLPTTYWQNFSPRTTYSTHPLLFVLRNLAAIILFVAGMIMLFTPGQGFLTMFAAFLASDFPQRKKLLQVFLHSKSIRKGLNRIRRRFGKAPFVFDR